jgi:NAD(P)-dependent dehydrogenase (short-subunit alcohol dehydrogenase family)
MPGRTTRKEALMRPLDEQTILITGATDGLGRALATALADAGATLLIHGRDDTRGQQTIDDIAARTGNRHLHWLRADLASLDEVRALAARVAAEYPRVGVLVNNAGIGYTSNGNDRRMESRDGYELRFAVNYLAGYLLTRLLLPHLQDSAPARIVNVASAGQAPIDFGDVMLEQHYGGAQAYRQSKLAQIMFTFDLADELDPRSATANCLHPATYMPIKIVRGDGTEPVSSLEEGVHATLRLIADPGLDGVTGRYFNGIAEADPHPQARDAAARRRLRDLSDRLCGLVQVTDLPESPG